MQPHLIRFSSIKMKEDRLSLNRNSNRDSGYRGSVGSYEDEDGSDTVQCQKTPAVLSKLEMDSSSHVDEQEFSDFRKYGTVCILFFVNLLNYMDRFTIAGKFPVQYNHKPQQNCFDGTHGLITMHWLVRKPSIHLFHLQLLSNLNIGGYGG